METQLNTTRQRRTETSEQIAKALARRSAKRNGTQQESVYSVLTSRLPILGKLMATGNADDFLKELDDTLTAIQLNQRFTHRLMVCTARWIKANQTAVYGKTVVA